MAWAARAGSRRASPNGTSRPSTCCRTGSSRATAPSRRKSSPAWSSPNAVYPDDLNACPAKLTRDERERRYEASMTQRRQLRLGAFMRPASIHTGAWRYPGAFPDANFNLEHLKRFAQTLERARFDAFFMADHLAVLNMPLDALKRSHTVTSFEPFTLLSALAMVTEHIGLVATGSTT